MTATRSNGNGRLASALAAAIAAVEDLRLDIAMDRVEFDPDVAAKLLEDLSDPDLAPLVRAVDAPRFGLERRAVAR